MTIYEVVMHVKMDLAEDSPEAAQRVIENKMNEGEMVEEVCQVYSIRPIPKHEMPDEYSTYELKYPVGRLRNYYGPGHKDLEVLREAFRQYVLDDAAAHSTSPDPDLVERIIDDAVSEVLVHKANSGFVHKLMVAVKANTEMQIHCKTHGEVMAFDAGNGFLHCPECYTAALSECEDIAFAQHFDKCVKLADGPYSMEAKSGVAGEVISISGSEPHQVSEPCTCGEETK